MKVLLVNKYFYLKGGAERVFFQERQLLRDAGVTVVDFAMRSDQDEASDFAEYFIPHTDLRARRGPLDKLRVAASFIHNRQAVRNIVRLVEREAPDIAHLHNIYHHLTPAIIPALKKRGVKVVLTLHDTKLCCPAYLMLDAGGRICERCRCKDFYQALTSGCQTSRFHGALLAAEAYYHRWRGSYDGVDRFIAPSRFMAGMVKRRVPENRITVLANGIETDTLKPDWRDDGYALFLGRLSPEKGLPTLLQAHRGPDMSDVPLRVVGTGPLEAELRQAYPDAEFLGYQSGEPLMRLIAHSAFVVVPSECYENCPMVVLEAMALGKPVLANRLGGIPDLVEDGITGRLVAPGDAPGLRAGMLELSGDPELRVRMGRAARERAQAKYSLHEHGRGLMEIYQQVLAAQART